MRKILFFLSLIASFAFSQPIAGEGDQLTYEKDLPFIVHSIPLLL